MCNTKKVIWRTHYNSSQKLLLVGEGDFSFSASLARAFRSAPNMVATSLLSQGELLGRHWSCEEHLNTLRERDCLVLHGVNVLKMARHRKLKHMKFDVIVFNFPHAGHVNGLRESNEELIQMHRDLLGGFFENASKMLNEGGEVHVTHKGGYTYDQWNLEELAEEEGLELKEKVLFLQSDHPGYHNKRGGEINGNKKFPIKVAFTFVFSFSPNLVDLENIEGGLHDLVIG